MTINAVKDAVRSLAQSLQVSTIFPASLFVLLNFQFIVPLFCRDFDCYSSASGMLMVSLTLTLSYALYAFNFPLIRFLEGYKWQDIDILEKKLKHKQEDYEERKNEIKNLRNGLRTEDNNIQLMKYSRRFDLEYPSKRVMVLPTRLGNTIAAFEDYPRTRYGMDSIALWGRLVPILQKEEYLEFVTQEKSVFDFLMNTGLVAIVWGMEWLYLLLFRGNILGGVIVAGLLCSVALIFYQGMIIAARQWGTTVKVAFDSYRHHLCERLYLTPTSSFEEETEQWTRVSRFFFCRDYTTEVFDDFMSQRQVFKPEQHIPSTMRNNDSKNFGKNTKVDPSTPSKYK